MRLPWQDPRTPSEHQDSRSGQRRYICENLSCIPVEENPRIEEYIPFPTAIFGNKDLKRSKLKGLRTVRKEKNQVSSQGQNGGVYNKDGSLRKKPGPKVKSI